MLLPVADVIAICSRLMLLPWWLMLYPPMGDVADVIAMVACWNGHRVTFNSDVVCRTSSWGSISLHEIMQPDNE